MTHRIVYEWLIHRVTNLYHVDLVSLLFLYIENLIVPRGDNQLCLLISQYIRTQKDFIFNFKEIMNIGYATHKWLVSGAWEVGKWHTYMITVQM